MNLWRDQQFVLCLSDEIVAEYLEVLARFANVRDEAKEFVAMLLERDNVVFVTPTHVPDLAAHDPDDAKFLTCALAAEAHVIVSGDADLLELRAVKGIPIVNPAGFLARHRSGSHPLDTAPRTPPGEGEPA